MSNNAIVVKATSQDAIPGNYAFPLPSREEAFRLVRSVMGLNTPFTMLDFLKAVGVQNSSTFLYGRTPFHNGFNNMVRSGELTRETTDGTHYFCFANRPATTSDTEPLSFKTPEFQTVVPANTTNITEALTQLRNMVAEIETEATQSEQELARLEEQALVLKQQISAARIRRDAAAQRAADLVRSINLRNFEEKPVVASFDTSQDGTWLDMWRNKVASNLIHSKHPITRGKKAHDVYGLVGKQLKDFLGLPPNRPITSLSALEVDQMKGVDAMLTVEERFIRHSPSYPLTTFYQGVVNDRGEDVDSRIRSLV